MAEVFCGNEQLLVQILAHTTSGIPMAANVPRYLARMSQLNKIKDDPTK